MALPHPVPRRYVPVRWLSPGGNLTGFRKLVVGRKRYRFLYLPCRQVRENRLLTPPQPLLMRGTYRALKALT
jgi:hypothetical protein